MIVRIQWFRYVSFVVVRAFDLSIQRLPCGGQRAFLFLFLFRHKTFVFGQSNQFNVVITITVISRRHYTRRLSERVEESGGEISNSMNQFIPVNQRSSSVTATKLTFPSHIRSPTYGMN